MYKVIVSPTPLALRAFILYGVIPPLPSIHRIAFWHPYLDMRLPGDLLDMDELVRGEVATREFRIKNMSQTYNAVGIVLDLESKEYGTALTDQYAIKRASEAMYLPNTTIASLAPGAISEVVSVRRITAANQPFRAEKLRVRSQITGLS